MRISSINSYTNNTFKGISSNSPDKFEHNCREPFGNNEKIIYNKKDGSLCHQVLKRNGKLISQTQYFPNEKKEIQTNIANDGSISVRTTMPKRTVVEKFNPDGRLIFSDGQDSINILM